MEKSNNIPTKSRKVTKVSNCKNLVDNDDTNKCLNCCEACSDEGWNIILYQMCLKWAHSSCAGVDKHVIKFVFDLCK